MRGLADLLPAAAGRYGDARALITDRRTLTFRELDRSSTAFAAGLSHAGLRPGDRVSLYSENRWEWLVAYHGILKAGLVVTPLNVMLTPAEVAHVAEDCAVSAIVGSASRLQAVMDSPHSLPTVTTLVSFDDPPLGCRSFEDLSSDEGGALRPPEIDPRAVGSVSYTSGTTGYPKGAMQPHRALLLNAALTATMHGRTATDVMVTALPAAHVYANAAIHATLLAGGTVVLQERFEPGRLLALAEAHRATMIEGVPTMYAALLAHEELGQRNLGALTRCTVGGQTMAIDTIAAWEEFSRAPLIELWGMTEIAGLGATHPVHLPPTRGSIGVSLPGVELRIADPDDSSRSLGPDQPGELMVRGPIVMLGYWGNDAASAEVLTDDGWLHTGDIAFVDDFGRYFVVDRKKDMIITAGYNVYPAEIERVIASHPAVSMVAVGKLSDQDKGETARAYVVLKPTHSLSAEDVLAHCRSRLAAYKIPRSVTFVDDLPKTSTGKIMRRELLSLDQVADPKSAPTSKLPALHSGRTS